jgi:hypothetical protein
MEDTILRCYEGQVWKEITLLAVLVFKLEAVFSDFLSYSRVSFDTAIFAVFLHCITSIITFTPVCKFYTIFLVGRALANSEATKITIG